MINIKIYLYEQNQDLLAGCFMVYPDPIAATNLRQHWHQPALALDLEFPREGKVNIISQLIFVKGIKSYTVNFNSLEQKHLFLPHYQWPAALFLMVLWAFGFGH
jgi:hypothetical protein